MDSSRIFRPTSIQNLSSPQQLNAYVRVVRPSVWIILVAMILLLTGVVLWAIFGFVTTELTVGATVNAETAICLVPEEHIQNLEIGLPVVIGEREGHITFIPSQSLEFHSSDDAGHANLFEMLGLRPGGLYRQVEAAMPGLGDGNYLATITVEALHPITLLT